MRLWISVVLAVLAVACGPKPDGTDGGTTDQDAGCDLTAGDSFQGGTFLDAGWSVEWEMQCQRPPDPLRAGFPVNGFCTTANRCAQVECSCPSNPSRRYAARGCETQCQPETATCGWALSAEPRLCQ